MPTPSTATLPKPKFEEEFEDIVVDVFSRVWGARIQRNGRRGQSQNGVDAYGTPPHLAGRYAGIQSKRVQTLTIADVRSELAKAETFVPALAEYVIATTADRDVTLQHDIRDLDTGRRQSGRFPVSIWFWSDIARELARHSDLVETHFPGWIPGSATSVTARTVPPRPYVDWGSFYPMPTEAGPRSSTHFELTVRPIRALPLTIDGDLLDEFRQHVERAFGITDTEPPRRLTSAYAVDLVWRDLPLRSARHWRRGQDGSVGYVTTIETMAAPGLCSLWDVTYDALLFCQLVRELPLDRDVTFTLDFQPGGLRPVPGPLAPTFVGRRLDPLPDIPALLAPADSQQTFRGCTDTFTPEELARPFVKLASLFVDRWRPMFDLASLRIEPLAAHLEQVAVGELGWSLAPMGAR
ncbi:MAG TPA: hypothetical protein VNV25_02850 [Gemmatimonadaceae bacterium]|jgi:hypothetical protein|nr:hypothetical protein [Gemmatimonadaceae bacterium]